MEATDRLLGVRSGGRWIGLNLENRSYTSLQIRRTSWPLGGIQSISVILWAITLLSGPTFAQALGCGGVSPPLVSFQQGVLTSQQFTVTSAPANTLEIDITDVVGNVESTFDAQSTGNNNWQFTVSSDQVTSLGASSIVAWMLNGGTRTFCDAAFANSGAFVPGPGPAGNCGSIANNNWTVSDQAGNSGTAMVTQDGNGVIGGTLSSTCGGTVYSWTLSGNYSSNSQLSCTPQNANVCVTVSNPSPSGGACFVTPSINFAGSIQSLACNSVTGPESFTDPISGNTVPTSFTWTTACQYPSSESSSFDQWMTLSGYDTIAGFGAQLAPAPPDPNAIAFSGRQVLETPSAPSDGCNQQVPGSFVSPYTLTGGRFSFDNNNNYTQDDGIGFFPNVVQYYRLQLYRVSGNNTGFSCTATVNQVMGMNTCGSATDFSNVYGGQDSGNPNTISFTLTASTVSARRGNASMMKTF